MQVAADQPPTLKGGGAGRQPDHVPCPFLREGSRNGVADPPTIVIRAGPKGDRGLSALDWAVMVGEPTWGTALQAVQEIDAGPIWPSRKLPAVPADPPRKSTLYNGPITDTAAQLIHEVITKAADPDFRPEPGDYTRPDVWGAQGTHRRTDDGQPLHTSGVVDAAPANGRETSGK